MITRPETRGSLDAISVTVRDPEAPIAANAKGANRDLYGCNVMLAPTGDWILSADDPKYVELEFEVSFSLGANGEPALMIDGQAY